MHHVSGSWAPAPAEVSKQVQIPNTNESVLTMLATVASLYCLARSARGLPSVPCIQAPPMSTGVPCARIIEEQQPPLSVQRWCSQA